MKLALCALGASLVLGVLGDALLRATPWGLNVGLWVGSLAVAATGLIRWSRHPVGTVAGSVCWLALPALFFAFALAWRDSPTLNCLSGLGLLITLALAALRARTGQLAVAGIMEYTLGLCVAGIRAAVGIFPLASHDIQWKSPPCAGWSDKAKAVARGIALALPLLLLFGALFAAADAVFADIVRNLFDWRLDDLLDRLFLIAFWACVSGGFLRELLLRQQIPKAFGTHPDRAGTAAANGARGGRDHCPRLGMPAVSPSGGQRTPLAAESAPEPVVSLGIVEIGIVLGALNVLFLAFLLVQFRYFFGGAALVQATIGLTWAEYARRGFFELVTVAALVLPVLLLAHWLLRPERPAHERLFRMMAVALVGMLFLIMASALGRMRLYTQQFGLTELRLYTVAFMGWLAAVFFWFLATVLCGRRERFAFGALIAGLVAIALLHGVNPDAVIVRANTRRLEAAPAFDAWYAASLSADAVPALVAALPQMNTADGQQVASLLLSRWSSPERADWRTWNWARAQAWRLMGANREALQGMAEARQDRSQDRSGAFPTLDGENPPRH
ncbi:MAG: DUF4173 domain-containing protein [Armatimonadetes bacterium]|nr:DUF4173 domain-containing protein [Armatimonadota bacterium]